MKDCVVCMLQKGCDKFTDLKRDWVHLRIKKT